MKTHKVKILKSKIQTQLFTSSSEPSPAVDSTVIVDSLQDFHSVCKWVIPNFKKIKVKSLNSRYFQVGGFDFRFLMYPKGDSLAVPGHISLYLQINDPCGSSCDCYAGYKITIVNVVDEAKSLSKESCYRFCKNRKSIGWCEFAVLKSVVDANSAFLKDGSLLVTAEIRVLNEKAAISSEGGEAKTHFLNGNFAWSLMNFGLFKEMVKSLKISSSAFRVAEASLGVNLSRSVVNGVEYLSLFLEIKDVERYAVTDRSCWCFYRIVVVSQKPGVSHVSKEHYGRFEGGGDTSLGWSEFMKMSDLIDNGYLVDDNIVAINLCFTAIQESSFFFRIDAIPAGKCKGVINCGYLGGKSKYGLVKKCDDYTGKFIWRIENFVRLKDILKKKKLTGLCVKSKRFQIGDLEFRLLVYPRGQSHKPMHLSLFLEVLDPGNTCGDWSYFIVYRLGVMNGKSVDNTVAKQAMVRCSKATKDYGWSELMTLTSLFDHDSGYLDHETAVFTAEVHILKETFVITESSNAVFSVTWKVENFLSFKDIMQGQSMYSRSFEVSGCKLRIGIYQSSGVICAYLTGDPSIVTDPDKNFWVSYRITMVNQNDPSKCLQKKSSLCTNTPINSDLQFLKVSHMLEADSGYFVHEVVTFVCEILDCCPWFELSEPEILAPGNVRYTPVTQDHLETRKTSHSVDKADHLSKNVKRNAIAKQYNEEEVALWSDGQVIDAFSQMNKSSKEWEKAFDEASKVLGHTPDFALGSMTRLLFKAATQCQSVPQAVKVARASLGRLGDGISPDVLDILSSIMHSSHKIAKAMLREIDDVFGLDEESKLLVASQCPQTEKDTDSGIRLETNSWRLEDEALSHARHNFFDISILIDMLAISSLTAEASQTFERGVAHGFIDNHVVALVLEKYAQRISANSTSVTENHQHEGTARKRRSAEPLFPEEFFTLVLGLAKTLSLSSNSRVHDFVKMFYVTLFRVFASESYHTRMLRGLADHAISSVDKSSEIILDVLVFLVNGEDGFAGPVLEMMRDAANHANTDCSAVRHHLEENVRIREEKEAELSNMTRENATLSARLTECEATLLQYKSEMGLERDRFACEKSELCLRMQDVESQLEQLCSKQKDQVAKLCMDKKDYQDRLHHLEIQLSQLKSVKDHEVKKLLKENKVLSERLRNAQAEKEILDRKLKSYVSEVAVQEEAQLTELDEILQLKRKVEQFESVKQDKEEEVANYRACANDMEAKLNDCQKHIQFLENARREEMEQHAPLYGIGLESLSIESLENLLRIHEDGIKNIHALQYRVRNRSGDLIPSRNPLRIRQCATYSASYC